MGHFMYVVYLAAGVLLGAFFGVHALWDFAKGVFDGSKRLIDICYGVSKELAISICGIVITCFLLWLGPDNMVLIATVTAPFPSIFINCFEFPLIYKNVMEYINPVLLAEKIESIMRNN